MEDFKAFISEINKFNSEFGKIQVKIIFKDKTKKNILKMIVIDRKNSGQDGVAEWAYDLFEYGVPISEKTTFSKLGVNLSTKLLDSVLYRLISNQLFNITKCEISGFKEHDVNKNVDSRLDFTFELDKPSYKMKIKEILTPFSDQLRDIDIRSIKLYGNSDIYIKENDKKNFKNVFFINFNISNVRLITDCDAWLPYDLRGEPQEDIYKLNSPRLEKALQEIEENINLEPVWDNTKYAITNKYKLENYSHEDEILNVYDD